MMSQRTSLVAGLSLAGVLLPAVAHAALVLDQSQTAVADPISFVNGTVQSFTPSADTLGAVEALTQANAAATGQSISVSLYSGLPSASGTLVATATDSSVSPGEWISAAFDTPVSVTPETMYYLVFSGSTSLNLMGAGGDPYSRGQVYLSNGGSSFPAYDLTFKTYAAPEPASLAVTGIAACYMLKRRRAR